MFHWANGKQLLLIIGISEIMLLGVIIAKKSLQFLFAHKTLLAQDIANILPTNRFENEMEAWSKIPVHG